jgi:hypothetical protein
MTIRACTPDDIAAVAGLFQSTFRDPRQAAPASLATYLRELFLEHPWYDPEVASQVYVAPDGAVGGFIGVLPLRMVFRGEPIRAGIAGSLMVHNPEENPLAGARLLRSFVTGPQDLSLSETANPLSQRMWERLGGEAVPAYSMEWLRVLQPAGLGLSLLGDWKSPLKLLRPLRVLVDPIATRLVGNPFALPAATAHSESDADVSNDVLLEAIPKFTERYPLRPDWDAASLGWFLTHAAHKDRHGELFRRMVYGKGREPIGCYLYYTRQHGIAWVLQMLAQPKSADVVVDSLFAHAAQQRSVAIRGRAQPEFLDALLRRSCVFFHRSSMVVAARRSELVETVRGGHALITGMAGEGWAQLIGGTFV